MKRIRPAGTADGVQASWRITGDSERRSCGKKAAFPPAFWVLGEEEDASEGAGGASQGTGKGRRRGRHHHFCPVDPFRGAPTTAALGEELGWPPSGNYFFRPRRRNEWMLVAGAGAFIYLFIFPSDGHRSTEQRHTYPNNEDRIRVLWPDAGRKQKRNNATQERNNALPMFRPVVLASNPN